MEVKLSKSTMIVSETDEKGNIVYVNGDFCNYAKYTKDELLGKPHNIVRHPDMPKKAFAHLWDTIKSGKAWSGIVKNRAKDGSYYWVQATIFSSQDTNGKKRYVSVRVKPTESDIQEANEQYKVLK